MLEMTLGLQSMGGKHDPISPSLNKQQGNGQKGADPDTLRFFSTFDALGEELKYKKAAVFALSACVNRNGNKLLPHIRPEMFPAVQLDFTEMERQIKQMSDFIERTGVPDTKADSATSAALPQAARAAAVLLRPSGLRTVSGIVLPEPVSGFSAAAQAQVLTKEDK
ncbi:MAG TPA: hypothetical protein VIJ46_00555, partial [Rhabdochlamydiaceae bacterium]